MSLAQRQRDRALTIALQKLLKSGIPADQGQVTEELINNLPEILGEPFFELREQVRRGKFRVDWQNEMFEEAAVDLEMIFDQDVEIVETMLGHLALAEVTGRRTGLEIRAIQSLLEDLLLTSSRGTNFFFTMFDTFNDLSKIDQAQSDVAVDLGLGAAVLASEASTKRILMGHLLQQAAPPVVVLQPAGARHRLVPGSKFSNAFEDLLTAWQQQVLTPTQSTVELAVNIPIVDPLGNNPGEEITRIQLHSLSATPFTVMPLWARGGIAFSAFPGLGEPIRVEDGVTIIDVPPTVCTSIQLRLKKTGPDSEELLDSGRVFSTLFGFRQISFWRMGHRRTGTLISKELAPQDADELPTISKVSLEVDELLPEGTKIEYAIASNAAPTSFIPITPLSRQEGEAPKVVDFAVTQRAGREENAFTVDPASPATSLGVIRGTEYFSLRGITDATIFQSPKLWRGKNAWHCKRETQSNIRTLRNLYIDFSRNDVQRFYVYEENERIPVHPANAAGTTEIELETRFPVLLESDEFQAGQDLLLPTDVSRPIFSIRRLLRRPVKDTVSSLQATGDIAVTSRSDQASLENSSQQASPTAGRQGAVLQISNFAGASLVPAPLGGAGIVPHLVGIPIQVTYTVNSLVVSGTFTTQSAQLSSDGTLRLVLDDPTEILKTATGTLAALTASWDLLATDMTPSVRSVVGNMIKLDRTQKLATEDLIEICYRRGLLPAEVPITASVVVKASTSSDRVYTQGVDYTLDLASRTIARIPAGSIGVGGDQSSQPVRIDFDFEENLLGLVTYRTFIYNAEPTPKLTLDMIAVDRENGEEVLLETSGGFLDLHQRDELPPLPSGWRQLVVRSNPVRAADGTIDKLSAIYKAVNLKEKRNDSDAGRFLMPATSHPDATAETTDKFANVFVRQQAFLEPMLQTTFQQLTTGTRKTDRTVFAIKEAATVPITGTAVLVVNYDPEEVANDLLYFPPDLSTVGLPLAREDFEFEYAFTPADVTTLDGLILRAKLSRSPDADGGLTPTLRRYTLRLSY